MGERKITEAILSNEISDDELREIAGGPQWAELTPLGKAAIATELGIEYEIEA